MARIGAFILAFILIQPVWALAEEDGVGGDECRPSAVLAAVNQDEEASVRLMSRTVEGLLRRLDCDLPDSAINDIRNDPTNAELIITKHSPECYKKIKAAYSGESKDGGAMIGAAVADALEMHMREIGCQVERGEIEGLIQSEYGFRTQQSAYIQCVIALHQVRSAEAQFKLDNGRYTDDISEIASYLVPGGETPTAEGAEAEVGKACCSAAGCAPADNPKEAWNADFGLDLSEDDGILIYGYPIGGPGCLIMVAPDRDDPDTFLKCYEEGREGAEKTDGGGE